MLKTLGLNVTNMLPRTDGGYNLIITCLIYKLPLSCYLQVTILYSMHLKSSFTTNHSYVRNDFFMKSNKTLSLTRISNSLENLMGHS